MKNVESCPVCGCQNFGSLAFPSRQALGDFPIRECVDCTHQFITNAPDDEELKIYYDRCYSKDERQSLPPGLGWRDIPLARTLTGKLPRNAHILEIGSNFGATLLAFPETYSLEGVELSTSAAAAASRNPRLKIYNDFFDVIAPRLQDGGYDCVIALAVIEHVRFPGTFLAHIARLLRPGGVAVLMTGDYATWNVRRLQSAWPLYHSDGHLHFFSARSLQVACAAAGLKVYSQLWVGPNPLTAKLPQTVGRALHCQTTTLALPYLFGRRPCGDLTYVWCNKETP